MTWPDGRRYIGLWSQGKQHGIGTYIKPNGKQRNGEWDNGKKVRWID